MVSRGSVKIRFQVASDSIEIGGLVGIFIFDIVNSEDMFFNMYVYSLLSFRCVYFSVAIVEKEFRVRVYCFG